MGIGVKETQEIIRQAVVLSRNEPAVPAKLEPQDVGMATGPRQRKRTLMRPGSGPEYVRSSERDADEWQRLDDDIYKFLQLRKDQFGRLGDPPSQQFIAEMEAQLKFADSEYELGTYLGLVRMAADLDQTRQTFVTASEKGLFRSFARRITNGRKAGEAFDPSMVKRYLDLVDANQPATCRGLADFFRLVARAARLPLLANMREAPSLSIAVLLQVVDLATRFNQSLEGKLEFQVGPVDVFLGARSVLFNRSVTQPTLSMVKELVLEETGLYHDDLLEWLQSVGIFGSELTLLMPGSLAEEGFTLQGGTYSAVEMVVAAGERLARTPTQASRALSTLSDAILFKIQQQDGHKDRQIQGILGHFNRLLHGERRSAARVNEERQQARFDYVSAIQRAGDLVKEIQTGQFRALPAEGQEERPLVPGQRVMAEIPVSSRPAGPIDAAVAAYDRAAEVPAPTSGSADSPKSNGSTVPVAVGHSAHFAQPAAAILAGLLPKEYEKALGEWDNLIGRIRKKLSTKSPVFKSLVSQLAKVRAIDTCLAYGLTPSGGRIASRLAKLIQSEDLRDRLGIDAEAAEAMEDAFSSSYPRFLASLEALILSVYDFRDGLQGLQFRLRDRNLEVRPELDDALTFSPPLQGRAATAAHGMSQGDRTADPRETVVWSDGSDVDEAVLKLILGAILLGKDAENERTAALSRTYSPSPEHPFRPDGRLRFPKAGEMASIGLGDPFLAYGSLLWVGRESLGQAPLGDLETSLMLMVRLTPEWRTSLFRRYRDLTSEGLAESEPKSPMGLIRRPGWESGFEMGFMGEIRSAYESAQAGAGLDSMLLAHLTAIQDDIDRACDILEMEKLRMSRERLMRFLE